MAQPKAKDLSTMQKSLSTKPKLKYDPIISKAARESNELDDTPDEKLVIGSNPNNRSNQAGARAFRTTQDRNKLRSLLPGMTDYGIDQVKNNVRTGKVE